MRLLHHLEQLRVEMAVLAACLEAVVEPGPAAEAAETEFLCAYT